MNAPSITLPCEITYEWSPELERLGARRFIARHAKRGLLEWLVIIVGIAALAVSGMAYWPLVALLALIPPCVWLLYYVRVTRIRYQMPDRRITVLIEQESITFETSEQRTTTQWSGIKQLWSFADVLLLFTYSKQVYTAVPAALLGEEVKRFIETKVQESGGEVC